MVTYNLHKLRKMCMYTMFATLLQLYIMSYFVIVFISVQLFAVSILLHNI